MDSSVAISLSHRRRSCTSMQVFRRYIKRLPDGSLDVSRVISRECFMDWLASKAESENETEYRKFHRVITNHTSGVDGRSPFEAEEEEAMLQLLRQQRPWPCFPPEFAQMGKRYRSKGYHERKRLEMLSCRFSSTRPCTSPALDCHDDSTQAIPHLTPFMSFSAPKAKALVEDNVAENLRGLSPAESSYLRNLASDIVNNFGREAPFTLQDWETINSIFRFMVLAKTAHCSKPSSRKALLCRAESLSSSFSFDSTTVAMVFDITAKTYLERGLAQNEYSLQVFPDMVANKNKETITDVRELYRIVITVGAAFHRPGKQFGVFRQSTHCRNAEINFFDMYYYVDPDSLLLVVFGKLCAAANGNHGSL